MPLIEDTMFGRVDKVKKAIERIKAFAPIETGRMDTPYYVAYSGGKDSDAIRMLCDLAGVKHELVHNHTTVDAPETVYYVRSIPGVRIEYPDTSMWALIVKKRMPPTRIVRYCCSELKERGGAGRIVVTGVRWAESVNRKKKRSTLEVLAPKVKDKIILNADNAEDRRLFEACTTKGKCVLNPIVDWTDADVWELLDYYGCSSNPLYRCGYKRVGCVGCPMASPNARRRDFRKWPKYQENYIHAFDRMIARGTEEGKPQSAWETGEEVFDWWLKDVNLSKPVEGQLDMWGAYAAHRTN